jgi:hypothetical protein
MAAPAEEMGASLAGTKMCPPLPLSHDSFLRCFVFLPFLAQSADTEPTPLLANSSERMKRAPSAGSQLEGPKIRRDQSVEFSLPLEEIPCHAPELLMENNDADGFRAKFLQRLASSNHLVPPERRAPRHQQVTIFDWDDTLLPTSHLQEGWVPTREELSDLEAIGIQLLEKGLTYGRTFIITNAVQGWVEHSAGMYYPRLASDVLSRVEIISARTDHEASYPGDHNQWKVLAFLEVKRAMRQDIITNLLSIGDSQSEMHAVHAMAEGYTEALVKTVKLCEQPTAQQLLKQIELVLTNFDNVATGAKDMSVSLQPVRPTSSAENHSPTS